jgi:hypothetical protein
MSEATRSLTRDHLPRGVEVTNFEPLLLKGAMQRQSIYELQVPVRAEDD